MSEPEPEWKSLLWDEKDFPEIIPDTSPCNECGGPGVPGTIRFREDNSEYLVCRFCLPEPLEEFYEGKTVQEILSEPCVHGTSEEWQWVKLNLPMQKTMSEIWKGLPQGIQIMLSYDFFFREQNRRKREIDSSWQD